jgi:hypothetical protein
MHRLPRAKHSEQTSGLSDWYMQRILRRRPEGIRGLHGEGFKGKQRRRLGWAQGNTTTGRVYEYRWVEDEKRQQPTLKATMCPLAHLLAGGQRVVLWHFAGVGPVLQQTLVRTCAAAHSALQRKWQGADVAGRRNLERCGCKGKQRTKRERQRTTVVVRSWVHVDGRTNLGPLGGP